jgi:hypothetical protein
MTNYNFEKYTDIEKYITQKIDINLFALKLLILYINIYPKKECDIIKYLHDITLDQIYPKKLGVKIIENMEEPKYYYDSVFWRKLFITNEISNLVKAKLSPAFLIMYDWSVCDNNIIFILESYKKFTDYKIKNTNIFELYYSIYLIHSKLNISNIRYNLVVKKNNSYIENNVNVYIISERGQIDTFVFPCTEYTICLMIESYEDGIKYVHEDYNNLSYLLNIKINDFIEYFKDYKYKKSLLEENISNIYNICNPIIKHFKTIHLN